MSERQVPIPAEARADEHVEGSVHEIAGDVAYQRLAVVNVMFIGEPGSGDRRWVLVDAGVQGSTGFIRDAASRRFGEKARPAAIVLTHGHIDHVGALEKLAEEWDAPIYAHELEHPYLDGRTPYPPPDPSVGGGMMALLSRFYPRGPYDVRRWLRALPRDRTVPELPGWRWIHTPGHTPGHVSLWRDRDRLLIAGDAFITTRQESAYAVATQELELHGPPMYFTPDWISAGESVQRLSMLEPDLAVTGHGRAMQGEYLRSGLRTLAAEFDRIAVPKHVRSEWRTLPTGDRPDLHRR
jgi:glyoxylase-like metal-dependent hydrolase (beta-lactamase superfamily II)